MNNLLSLSTPLIIDAALCALVLIFIIVGAVKGFAKSFIGAFGGIIAFVLAIIFCEKLAAFVDGKFSLAKSLGGTVQGWLVSLFGEDSLNVLLSEAKTNGFSDLGIASGILTLLIKAVGNAESFPADITVGWALSLTLAFYMLCIISFLVLLIVIKILFRIIDKIFSSADTVIIGSLNRVLGALFGIIKAALLIFITMLIFTVIPLSFIQDVIGYIQQTVITKFLYENNLITLLLEKLNISGYIQTLISGKVV